MPVLLVPSLLILIVSLFLPLVSVHTYCENRTIAAIFGVIAILLFVFFFRSNSTDTVGKVTSRIGMSFCILALSVNVGFILLATKVCSHMFDQLR